MFCDILQKYISKLTFMVKPFVKLLEGVIHDRHIAYINLYGVRIRASIAGQKTDTSNPDLNNNMGPSLPLRCVPLSRYHVSL